ncbi:Crp/Fnr family transcriptional regulator [Croceivirga thetidis]|uniref:Crp/Fnr family transcriptional regulator n=1 Tax=Croceivirga thetidis TaxID=2721623 RepID=A0ABX1GKK0_9FLAO|nr:Crp/Fnr family transcriptional regulator [Croceivirga thetidis]NKI30440.1 Crp/Fnr family transcriptional regulator [Croceivirga thetidis]
MFKNITKSNIPITKLVKHINEVLLLNEKEEKVIKEVFTPRRIKRRQFVHHEGDVCKYANFVVEGCLKMYMVDENAKEHILQFAIENSWIGDLGSFHSGEPSKLYVEALENSVILQITKKNLYDLYEEYPKFNKIFRIMKEKLIVEYQNRILQNISSTGEERYLDFLNRHPDLFNRISNVQIASYLGVTPVFLSMIRKKLAKA